MSTPPKTSSIQAAVQKKMSIAMTKGRPGSLSLPSFTFRFKNTDDEEGLEEIWELNESSEALAACDSTEKLNRSDQESSESTVSPPTSPVKTSSKLTKPKISGKRTQSLDDGSPEHSTATDKWALLSEIKGKIARTVEEKLHSSGIYKKDTKEVPKSVVKSVSPVEAEEATEDLEASEVVKNDSSPFNLRRMWNSSESPQLRLRRKEVQPQQQLPAVEDVVSFSELLSESSTNNDKSRSPSPEKSSPAVVIAEPQKEESSLPEEMSDEISAISVDSVDEKFLKRLLKKYQRHKSTIYAILLAIFMWYILPSFLSGLIFGVAVTVYLNRLWQRLNQPRIYRTDIDKPPSARMATPLPASTENQPTVIRKVWMNELLSEYNPENYHLSMTESVLVRLDGSALRLSYPKSKIRKRAMWNESFHESSFIHQKYYDIKGAKVELLPDGLARKRRWSRRYPIQIRFSEISKQRDSASLHPHLTKENDKVLILFARSGRDKEEWFWIFKEAILGSAEKSDSTLATEHKFIQHRIFKYHVYMSRLIQSPVNTHNINSSLPGADSGVSAAKQHDTISVDSSSSSPTPSLADNVDWLNILLGRCCSDVLLDSEDNEWIERISDRIQRKLSLIKVPYFMDELRLSDLEIGTQLPQISNVSSPYLNERGLWFHANVSYFGSFRMTLETKLNLLRLKKDCNYDGVEMVKEASSCDFNGSNSSGSLPRLSAIYDSEAEESVESSSDEEPFPDTREGEIGEETTSRPTTGNKILRLVDSIAQSRYFQQATEYKYVKKAMVGVSNTPLILTVELLSLSGTLAVNIPPPPTDRLWYGFRNNPDLVLVAKPKVGERQVQIAQITEWIEKKLIVEFQRILVLPNMEDLVIPILDSSFTMKEVKEPNAVIPTNSMEADVKEPSVD